MLQLERNDIGESRFGGGIFQLTTEKMNNGFLLNVSD